MRFVTLLALSSFIPALLTGCGDHNPRTTTPRPEAQVQSSDGASEQPRTAEPHPPEARGTGQAPHGTAAEDAGEGQVGVPGGLDMRGGAGGTAAPAAGLSRGGGGANPRTLPPPWIGGANARVVIEEFSNFECPYCILGAKTTGALLAHYGSRIKLVYRHLPLAYQPQAKLAAQASVCAQAQGKFWSMKALLFTNNRNLSRADLIGYARRLGLDVPRFTRDLDSGAGLPRVEADIQEARKRVIEGTPAYFINGEKHEGALPLSEFQELIDAALRQ